MPQVNTDLLESVEATATSPLTIQYVINPKAVWSDGVPVTADDFIYAWKSQRGDGVDVDGQPDQVASTLGYRDVASVTGSHGGRTVTVVFARPYADWRIMFNHMVPAHIARTVGWNHGFATFNPAVDLSAGPLLVTSVSSGNGPSGAQSVLVGDQVGARFGDGVGRPDRCGLDRPAGHVHHGACHSPASSTWPRCRR